MGSQPDNKTRNATTTPGKGHVVEDERGHNIWEGTIRTVKLTLMKTGIFSVSDSKPSETGDGPSEELEVLDDGGGFDPYDSTK